jgi:hypothetical protein
MENHDRTDKARVEEIVHLASNDEDLRAQRQEVARFAALTFLAVGTELHVLGHIVGEDRIEHKSPFGHGSDEAVAISLLLRIAAQLVSASTDLFSDDRHYAAAALVRQMVEIEYLAWAMETKDGEAERWLRSDRSERESFFTPAKLRKAAQGKFRGKDYGYHCELGGHPVPRGSILLGNDPKVSQLLLSDLLGHTGRIWDHLVGWAGSNSHGEPILKRRKQMLEKFVAWKKADPLAWLPPPP